MVLIIVPAIVSAKLEIEKRVLVDVIVPETKQKAAYELEIRNLGESDTFKIYSLVGVEMWPKQSFTIASKETKTLKVEMWPEQAVLDNPGTFNFVYKIVGEKTGIQDDVMLIKIINLKDALDINSYNINFDSDTAVMYVRNRVSLPFAELKAHFYSVFFDFSDTFSLDAYGKKEFDVALNKQEIKELVAGSYMITADIETYGVEERIENTFRFTEKEEITTKETKKGTLISKQVIEKINEGNLPSLVYVKVKKNIISRLFTTFNVEAAKVEREGFIVNYIFQKEIRPAEIYTIKVTTNWFYPLLLLAALVFIGFLVRVYTSTFLSVRKRVTFVRTKGGEFALKIGLIVRAKKFVEKIKVIDKIPGLVKVHERFGIAEPDKIDEKNRRLEWNIEALQPEEERIFSYIIYSKIAPIGKFELPTATAIYEREGKIHEAESNKVFFLTEPRRKEA